MTIPISGRALRIALWFGGVVALILFPLYSTPYSNLQVSLVAVFTVVLIGLNLNTGWGGQVSLGQSAFFGVGAYAAAIAAAHGFSWVFSLLLAIALPAAVGALVAIPATRLSGHALGMLTLALPLVAVPLAKRLDGLTGGSQGLIADLGRAPAWSGLADDQWAYYLCVGGALLALWVARSIVMGRTGRALALIRTNEVVAASTGVSVRGYKTLMFTISAGFAGAGGFLYVICVRYVSPESLSFLLSVTLFCCLFVGGLRSIAGTVIAAAFYVYTPSVAGAISPEHTTIIFGLSLLAVLFLAPAGIAGLPRLLLSRRGRRTTAPITTEAVLVGK